MSGKDIREAVGLLAVVAGLVFVGIEIRQNTAAARGQTRQDLAALNQEWLVLHSTNAEFSELYTLVWNREGDVDEVDMRRAGWMMRLNLRRLENVYLQYAEGLVDETALNSYGLQARGPFRTERFGSFWESSRGAYDPGFVAFFEEQVGIAN